MNRQNYADILPNPNCSPQDALESLIDKVPRYTQEGLFNIDDFLQVFVSSIHNIVNNLPDDPNKKKEIEIELAYIIHGLYINQGIIIARDNQMRQIRGVELVLDNKGLLQEYIGFASGINTPIDISEPEYFRHFLDYLFTYISNGILDMKVYLQACIGISQLGDEGMRILNQHIEKRLANMGMEHIDKMIETYGGYLGAGFRDIDERIEFIMAIEDLNYQEATTLLRQFQEDCARIHLYVSGLYKAYIKPKKHTVSVEHMNNIASKLNDLRDILDPEHFVPFFCKNGNSVETFEREKAIREGRELH